MKRISSIDALRILAALAVVLHHYGWVVAAQVKASPLYPTFLAVNGGFLGVTLFFMISGFVILMSAASGCTAGQFVSARAVRLYPAFWICCTMTWLVTGSLDMSPMFDEYLANMTMFPTAAWARPVDGVYWTLAFEAKFYVLIALLLATGRLSSIEVVLWIWLALSRLYLGPHFSALIMSTYAPYFIGGCACYLLARGATWNRWALFVAATVAGTMEARGNDIAKTALVFCYFPLLLALAHGWICLPASRWLAVLGAISYPLYLLHKEIGYRLIATGGGGWTAYLGAIAASLALAAAVALIAERPLQRRLRAALGGPRAGSTEPPEVGRDLRSVSSSYS
jgi:peptidoglycan/LPS O-acetylase OafA/YrhL